MQCHTGDGALAQHTQLGHVWEGDRHIGPSSSELPEVTAP